MAVTHGRSFIPANYDTLDLRSISKACRTTWEQDPVEQKEEGATES